MTRPSSAGSTREFPLWTILTVITGIMIADYYENNRKPVDELLRYMTGENLFVASLPRARAECREPLLEQHPALAGIEVPDFQENPEKVAAWLAVQTGRFGETLPVAPLHPDDHTRIPPAEEMRRLSPNATIITLPEEE